jgi:hypothetical protein
MGDFYQLPPVADTYTLYGALVKMFTESKEIEHNSSGPLSSGAQLFSKSNKFDLT